MKTPRLCVLLAVLLCLGLTVLRAAPPGAATLASPDGKLAVVFQLSAEGAPTYEVRREGVVVLAPSRLGLVADDADFSTALTLVATSKVTKVTDRYELLTAKRRENTYRARRQVFTLANAAGQKLEVIFQVSDDGVAFRYRFPETSATPRTIKDEVSSFRFVDGTRAWLQPMSVAKTGWKNTNPSYEEYYQKDIAAGTPSTLGAGWVFPALFKTGDTWLLVSEGTLGRGDAGTRLRHEAPGGEYAIGLPDPRETKGDESVNPRSTLPWTLPWRFLAIGSLKTIVETNLGNDLATPVAVKVPAAALKPGKASWSWPQLGDAKTNYEVQKQFIDYAASMGWTYCLIDALWDKQIGYEKTAELIAYAKTKNVRVLLWYNSNGNWNAAPQTPLNKLNTPADRRAEFDRLAAMGVAGLKVDFFGGDGRAMIELYHDLLEETAPYGFLMNFHGATLPRGWQRTYPHLMTAEAIKGFEFITFEQENADEEPTHAAMLPFTRNVFDPMDFTPVCLEKTGKTKLRTTRAFQLAQSVLCTSGIQHYVDFPEGMAKMPAYVQEFMKRVPSVWDDTKFIDGFPGKFAVLARKGQGERRWYVAGINGEDAAKPLTLDLRELTRGRAATATLIIDGPAETDLGFVRQTVKIARDGKLAVTLAPHGGFTLVIE